MNHIIIMGRLTKDPEVGATQGGTEYARYTVAVDRKYKKDGQQNTDFFPCTSFGKQANFVEKYLKKGTKVVLSGEMNIDKNEDKTYPKIIVSDIEFAESKNGSTETKTEKAESKDVTDFLNIPDGLVEELPFS